jgi:hypothetical protein
LIGATDPRGDVLQLASAADDRMARLAFAIDGITDKLERVLLEVAELRVLVDEQRSRLDELRDRVRPKPRTEEPPACTWRLVG